jgi:hypothetical protein
MSNDSQNQEEIKEIEVPEITPIPDVETYDGNVTVEIEEVDE